MDSRTNGFVEVGEIESTSDQDAHRFSELATIVEGRAKKKSRWEELRATEQRRQARNAKYGPYFQIRKYLGLYFAVFTVKKRRNTSPQIRIWWPPNSYSTSLRQA